MSLTEDEQALYDFAEGALPSWITHPDPLLTAAAKQIGASLAQARYLFAQALIGTAEGATSTTPDWLNQHARDRNTSRQAGESDVALRERLRTIPDAVTRQAILDAANAILAAAGVSGEAALVELPRDAAWVGTYTALTGTGGTFVQVGTDSRFTPTVPWATPPYRAPGVTPELSWTLTISGAANAANNGTRAITGLVGNAAVVSNASGIAGADGTVSWIARRLDALGNGTDFAARSYAGRGFRASVGRPLKLIVILPYGTTAGTAASVLEAIRQKKAAGFAVVIERRLNP